MNILPLPTYELRGEDFLRVYTLVTRSSRTLRVGFKTLREQRVDETLGRDTSVTLSLSGGPVHLDRRMARELESEITSFTGAALAAELKARHAAIAGASE